MRRGIRTGVTGAAALLALVGLSAPAQDCPATAICGTVVDGAGAPVASAEVTVEGGGSPVRVLTDPAGRFRVDGADGALSVTVSAPGRDPVTVAPADLAAAGARLVLPDVPAPEGADVLVKARRVSLPFSRQVIGKLDLLTDPIANADALLAVAGLPSATNLDNSADVQLRGSAIGLSRVYYNDVPLYEVVRGSSVDQVTRVSSIFNASLVQQIETYPTLPPAYLPNTAAGAVRIIPDIDGAAPSTVFLGLPGATATAAFQIPQGGVQAYASVIDLSATLAVNPKLKRTTRAFTSSALGAAATTETEGGTELTALAVLDVERGEYPLRLLNLSGISSNRRLRAYGLFGMESPVGDERLKLDFAATGTANRLAYRDREVSARNLYLYANADLAGDLPGGRLEYRAGVSGEHFRLTGSGAFTGDAQTGRVARRVGYGALHAFLTTRPASFMTVAAGTRQYAADGPAPGATYSAAATLFTRDRRHKLIAGLGTFGTLVPPELVSTAPIAAARSRQTSVDYEFTGGGVQLKAGGYIKSDRFGGTTTRIEGVDGSIVAQPTPWLRLSGSFAHSRQRSGGFRADRDLGYFVRLQSRVSLSETAALNATYTTKSGAPYTRVVSGAPDGAGGFFPVFDDRINARRLSRFETLDVNLIERLRLSPSAAGPIIFISVTNLLDRPNQARPVYDPGFTSESRFFYERRAVSFGIVQSF